MLNINSNNIVSLAVTLILLSVTALANTTTVHAQEPTSGNLELASFLC